MYPWKSTCTGQSFESACIRSTCSSRSTWPSVQGRRAVVPAELPGQESKRLKRIVDKNLNMELVNGSNGVETDDRSLEEERQETERKLNSITEQVNRCAESVIGLKNEIDNKSLTTQDGMSFLEVKNQLLVQYLINLTGIVKLKTGGKSIQESVFLKKLVELRTYLEKIKPIETKLRYQIDKMVNAAAQGTGGADPLKFRANLDDLQNDGDESEEDSEDEEEVEKRPKSGIYRPPKVAPQSLEDEEDVAPAKKAEKMRKKSINQSLIRELQEEFLDTPVEIHNMGDAYAKQLSREVKDKQRYEENYMTRLPVTKQDKHRAKAMSTIGVLGDEITSFKGGAPGGGSKGKKRKFGGKKKGKGKKFKKN